MGAARLGNKIQPGQMELIPVIETQSLVFVMLVSAAFSEDK